MCVVCVEGDGDGGGNVVMITMNDNVYDCDSNKSYVVVDGLFVCIKCSWVVLATPGRLWPKRLVSQIGGDDFC